MQQVAASERRVSGAEPKQSSIGQGGRRQAAHDSTRSSSDWKRHLAAWQREDGGGA